MPHADGDLLQSLTEKFLLRTRGALSPAERAELVRIAQGFACKDSAMVAGLSDETIRARRKRIYRKLGLAGSHELLSALLRLSLWMLSHGESVAPKVPANAPPADEASSQPS